jgi:hypothetical protein
MDLDISQRPEQLARAIDRLRHPRPGSKIDAAREFGVDLTLLITNLRLTPAERVAQMESAIEEIERISGVNRRTRE